MERLFDRFYRVDPARSRDVAEAAWACRSVARGLDPDQPRSIQKVTETL